MRCPKSVTPLKVEANRRNAKHSSGPRTGRGKRNAKFNAVTLGLFAKYVVIPVCDGYKAERDFKSLLDGMHQEFQPVGFYEEWLVVKIAECMWRLRRATRCESGSVRESAIWADHPDSESLISKLGDEVWVLRQAEEQLRDFGTLSQKTYEQVAPLVEKEKSKAIESEKDDRRVERDFDHQGFLTCIANRREFLESFRDALARTEGRRSDARLDYEALLPEDDMDRILRYEERMHRQIDWVPAHASKALRRWGLKLAERGGKNGKKRAVIATARKLAVLLHRLWVSGEAYEPLRHSRQVVPAAA